jgi:hypothetical protein
MKSINMKTISCLFGLITYCSLSAQQNEAEFAKLVQAGNTCPPKAPQCCNPPPSCNSDPQVCNVGPCFERGDDTLPCCSPTYIFPASVHLKKCWSPDIFGTVSYIYWHLHEEGLELATVSPFVGGSVEGPQNGGTIFQDFEYKSGFKVGLGTALPDDWVLSLDYTYLHSTTKTSASATLPLTLFFTSWFYQGGTTGSMSQALAASSLSSKWHLGLDWLDATLSRPFYQGRKLVSNLFSGVRASWIRQSLRITADGIVNATPPSEPIVSNNQSHSWGIGPRAGVENQWFLGGGVKLLGKMGASLIFTQYTRVSHSESQATLTGHPVSYSFHNLNTLRPMFEMGLGLGWGSYFACQRYHFDLNANYEFNYLMSQNMMRMLNDVQIAAINAAANALHFHGLTLTARFDF